MWELIGLAVFLICLYAGYKISKFFLKAFFILMALIAMLCVLGSLLF